MRYRKLTEDGDMTFGSGQADFYRDDIQGVTQSILTRLRLWRGEWFLDITEGTPYVGAILGKYTKETIEPALRQRILNTDGVTEIESFEMEINPDTRVANINISIKTIYSSDSVQIDGVL